MRSNALLPFIGEFLLLALFVSLLLLSLFGANVMTISINLNILGTLIIVVLGVYFLMHLSRVINWGIRATVDVITGKTNHVEGTLITQKPFRASMLTETRTKGNVRSSRFYWTVLVETSNGIVSLLSAKPLQPIDGSYCCFEVGKTSSIIISVNIKD